MKTIQLLILLNFFIFFKVAGQDSTNIELENMAKFNLSLTTVKIAYVPPKQYKKSYLSYNAIIGPMLLSGTRHQLEDIKDSIFVYFTVDGIDTSEKYISKMKRFGIPWDMNKNYLKTHSDTLKHPIVRNPSTFTKNKYNADASGYFELPLQQIYANKYQRCRVAFIHKENRADIILYFFYNPGNSAIVQKHMNRVLSNIKFIG